MQVATWLTVTINLLVCLLPFVVVFFIFFIFFMFFIFNALNKAKEKSNVFFFKLLFFLFIVLSAILGVYCG